MKKKNNFKKNINKCIIVIRIYIYIIKIKEVKIFDFKFLCIYFEFFNFFGMR